MLTVKERRKAQDGLNLVEREANLAQRRGLNIGGVGTILVNSQGEVVLKGINRATEVDQLPTGLNSTFSLNDETVLTLLKRKIYLKRALHHQHYGISRHGWIATGHL